MLGIASGRKRCTYIVRAGNASASKGTSSGQYRVGRGWRAPISAIVRWASTAVLRRWNGLVSLSGTKECTADCGVGGISGLTRMAGSRRS